jgi:tetratricopeptide (TPR) repeat protein
VSGPPASVAAQLEGHAPSGAVLLDAATYARVRDALHVEQAGDAWLVRDVVPGAPAVARRLDTPLVGRAGELARLRAAYADVQQSGRPAVVTVVGEAGIGKTRLLRELVLPLRENAPLLVGRCVSYGEGATYLPIAEAVRQVASSVDDIAALLEDEDDGEQVAQRIAELTGLADVPAAPSEAFWAVRRFLETLARDRPLVLVLDDIHWAEPTLLDLVEYLGEWTEASLLVLCAARRELLERRPAWGGPTSTGFVVELTSLGADEVAELLRTLSEEPLAAEVQAHIVEQAGGNPLFAEQLLALAREAPNLAFDATPPTVEALLASRLGRLDPRELAVLRRASVIGRRFTRDELADLTPREALRRTPHQLAALADRALVHPREHVYAFHHPLVREVAYRGIPKSERAELHELAARGLDRRNGADEIVGYHLEQAHGAVVDVAPGDNRAANLAAEASERLGNAGIRAWKRADARAAVNLLSRAVKLSPDPDDRTCELGVALFVIGEPDRARELLSEATRARESRIAARARFELAQVRSMLEPDRARDLADEASSSIPILEAAGDDRALGRVWLSVAHVRGDFFCEYAAMEDAAARAVEHYERAGWSPSAALNSLGIALFYGPKPTHEGIAMLETLRSRYEHDRGSEANLLVWLGGLEAMLGAIEQGRAHVLSAQERYAELGLTTGAGDTCNRMLGFIEQLAQDFDAAESVLRRACAVLEQHGHAQVLATRAGELARVLYVRGRYDEADQWMRAAQTASGADDLDAALAWRPVDAMLRARHGDSNEAEQRLRELLEATPKDAVLARAETFVALADVLRLAARDAAANDALSAAVELYEEKGNLAGVRALQKSEEPVRGSSLSN